MSYRLLSRHTIVALTALMLTAICQKAFASPRRSIPANYDTLLQSKYALKFREYIIMHGDTERVSVSALAGDTNWMVTYHTLCSGNTCYTVDHSKRIYVLESAFGQVGKYRTRKQVGGIVIGNGEGRKVEVEFTENRKDVVDRYLRAIKKMIRVTNDSK